MTALLTAMREALLMLGILALLFGGISALVFSVKWVIENVNLPLGAGLGVFFTFAVATAICYFTRYPK